MKARVYKDNRLAGDLEQTVGGYYIFTYDELYFTDSSAPSISLTLPKNTQKHTSPILFPFFFNMLAEGANLALQCRQHQIDQDDYFSLLLATSSPDGIGSIRVEPFANDDHAI